MLMPGQRKCLASNQALNSRFCEYHLYRICSIRHREKSQFYKINKELRCGDLVLMQTLQLLEEGGVAADARESIRRDTTTLATATDSELEESDPFADVEEDEDELEENKLVLEDC